MNKILVGLDGSPRAKDVLRAAVALAARASAKLILFQAVTVAHMDPHDAMELAPDEVMEALLTQARGYLESCAVGVDVVEKVRACVGAPWETICRVAQQENVALIMIGSHGYGVLDRLLGTTAAKVVNHADRSVLVVRAPELIEA